MFQCAQDIILKYAGTDELKDALETGMSYLEDIKRSGLSPEYKRISALRAVDVIYAGMRIFFRENWDSGNPEAIVRCLNTKQKNITNYVKKVFNISPEDCGNWVSGLI